MFDNEILIAAPIAILYPFFVSKAYDYHAGITSNADKCRELRNKLYEIPFEDRKSNPEYNKINDLVVACDKESNALENKKFMYMVVIAIASIIIAVLTKSLPVTYGVGAGSIILLLYTIFMNWHSMYEGTKILIMGLALVVLLYASMKYFGQK